MAYWDWSWDELASNDLSAAVQYVYAQSDQQKLHYIGHSLGTLVAFAALSQRQQPGMLRSAGLLSPIAYLNKVASPLALAELAPTQRPSYGAASNGAALPAGMASPS